MRYSILSRDTCPAAKLLDIVSDGRPEEISPCFRDNPEEIRIIVAKTGAAKSRESESGKLRIGDDWNAIRIIALSQANPLKAIAELVENSIDAHAKTITIT